ncbi:MAG TPA: PEGA domain-containing protein [Kofleriaceae bacterium]|nr:PEGA domain-containing protein [Kofleriaceae bacterium]
MTTGAPIYLVSACTSGEEFVAAFRRYADRNGLFVPISEPIPAGRRGRFAVTLRDGGVMIEGDGEVISSGSSPSVLHGRVGMTIRFGELDPDSKTVIVELEKARLAMRPPPPSVPPRPATVPAQPRPLPAPIGGRVDAHNALAQCVAIGDVAALQVVEPKPVSKPGARFVVPTIPPVAGAPRAKPPSMPPIGNAAPVAAAELPAMPRTDTIKDVGPPAAMPTKASAKPTVSKPPSAHPIENADPDDSDVRTLIAPPPRPPGAFSATLPAVALPERKAAQVQAAHRELDEPTANDPVPRHDTPTDMAAMPPPRMPAKQMRAVMPPPSTTPTEMAVPPSPSDAIARPIVEEEATDLSVIPDSAAEPTGEDEQIVPQVDDELGPAPPPPRSTTIGVAVSPSGAQVLPAFAAPEIQRESTEVNEIPLRPPARGAAPAKPIAREPSGRVVVGTPGVDPHAKTLEPENEPEPAPPPKPSRPSPAIEEATPSGDWTMAPGDHGPTIQPRAKKPTGDWTMSVDPQAPDGWSEPSKVDLAPLPAATPTPAPAKPAAAKRKPTRPEPPPGPPQPTVASARPIEARAPRAATAEPAPAEPKVQIDPTLIEPLAALPIEPASSSSIPLAGGPQAAMLPSASASDRALAAASASQPYPQIARAPSASHTGPAMAILTPSPGSLPSASAYPTASSLGFHVPSKRRASTPLPAAEARQVSDATKIVKSSNKRLVVIVLSAMVAAAAGVVAFVMLGDDDGKSQATTTPPPLQHPVETLPAVAPDAATAGSGSATDTGSGSSAAIVATIDAGVAPPAPAVEPKATDCTVDVSSTPTGAEIVAEAAPDQVLGTTNAELHLPCNDAVKLVIRKPRYVPVLRNVVPTSEGIKLRVALARTTFSVKVSSQPPGATITLNGKSLGVTPTTVRLPAFEASTLTIAKDGFATETQKITPKQNNQALHTQLKKQTRKSR